jgi:hypothetical protein
MSSGTGNVDEDMFGTDYNITPDNLVKGMTYLVIFIFIFMGVIITSSIIFIEEDIMAALVFVVIILVVAIPTLYFSWVTSPSSYMISAKGVTIQRPWKPILIPMNKIKNVESIEISYTRTMRAGNGGIFSISGKFYNKKEGWFWMYIKNKNFVKIEADKKWVVSPDDRELFITDLKGKLEKAQKPSRPARKQSGRSK